MFSIPLLSDVPGPGHYMGYTAMGWMVGWWVDGWMDGWVGGWMDAEEQLGLRGQRGS